MFVTLTLVNDLSIQLYRQVSCSVGKLADTIAAVGSLRNRTNEHIEVLIVCCNIHSDMCSLRLSCNCHVLDGGANGRGTSQ